jgi:hypothetical protein|nr:MAG: hypothetical protein [Bacteriophage sp.]
MKKNKTRREEKKGMRKRMIRRLIKEYTITVQYYDLEDAQTRNKIVRTLLPVDETTLQEVAAGEIGRKVKNKLLLKEIKNVIGSNPIIGLTLEYIGTSLYSMSLEDFIKCAEVERSQTTASIYEDEEMIEEEEE